MATYLHIDGIEGSVTAPAHKQWIEIKDIDFAITRHINTLPGQIYDRQLSRPNISEIEIIKPLDNSSIQLFQHSCSAKAISQAKIDLCQINHDGNPYAQITLSNVIITCYQLHQSNEGEQRRPLETLKLNFDRIEFRYTPYDKNNQAQSPLTTGYDLKHATQI
jgi:type VI secretion system secreted protein Hcp